MTTTHANSAEEALKRVEELCMMAGLDLSVRAIREQIGSSVHIVVQQTRFSDGSRRITSITEVAGLNEAGDLVLHDIFRFNRAGVDPSGGSVGTHQPTGYVPSFLHDFAQRGLLTGGLFW
jgi:pilus assembly protein CpaF